MSYGAYHLEGIIRHSASFNLLLFESSTMAFSSQYVQNGLNDKMEILFQFLRYWGLRHKWNMCDGFMFDRRYFFTQRERECIDCDGLIDHGNKTYVYYT